MSSPLVQRSFSHILDYLLNDFDAGAIMTKEGELVGMKYENLADIGTLGVSGQTILKYFKLKDGDAIMINDPFAGGTALNHLTVVTPLTKNADLIFVTRLGFKPMLQHEGGLSNEGLKIPPTPITSQRQVNETILQAVASHPQSHATFTARLQKHFSLLWPRIDQFRKLTDNENFLQQKQFVKSYLDQSRNFVLELISELPHGEERTELKSPDGKSLKLKMSLQENGVNFDFSGTSAPQSFGLTDSMTLGACIGALAAFFEKDFPFNSGSFSLFNVITPTGSFLNAPQNTATTKGVFFGTGLVASSVYRALGQISSAYKVTANNPGPVLVSFAFKDHHLFDSLASGVSATSNGDGTDAIQVFIRNKLQSSVEMIESLYPIRITKSSLRPQSGGRGQFKGGSGIHREYVLLEDAEFTWATEPAAKQLTGQNPGNGFEIQVWKNGQKESQSHREFSGSLKLSAGDRVAVATPGGWGFGAKD